MAHSIPVEAHTVPLRLSVDEALGDVPHLYLFPGQVFATGEPLAISTILGTCVSVCLHDPVQRVGGMNHFLLPHWARSDRASARYGNVAIEQLMERFVAAGGELRRAHAKLFGGMTGRFALPAFDQNLGKANVDLALRCLAENHIAVIAQDVGGPSGRKLVFRSDLGVAWVKSLE